LDELRSKTAACKSRPVCTAVDELKEVKLYPQKQKD